MPEELTFGERMRRKGISFLARGRTRSSRVVAEGRLESGPYVGQAYQTRQDELGNRVRVRSTGRSGVDAGQDVRINAPLVRAGGVREVRDVQP
ncbi:hypothetical protein AB0395_41195 [Streptosporangium sp. NPDC051023]|uniref:hypothetical protein n=1 Tax=Streptosporangium sp. NPDC051023 TaxID=3155410 RepID=UPI00344CEF47